MLADARGNVNFFGSACIMKRAAMTGNTLYAQNVAGSEQESATAW
jgi:hypothetical protein